MSEFLKIWDETGEFPFVVDQNMSLYAGYLFGAITKTTTTLVPYEERKIMLFNLILFIEEQVVKDYTVTDASK